MDHEHIVEESEPESQPSFINLTVNSEHFIDTETFGATKLCRKSRVTRKLNNPKSIPAPPIAKTEHLNELPDVTSLEDIVVVPFDVVKTPSLDSTGKELKCFFTSYTDNSLLTVKNSMKSKKNEENSKAIFSPSILFRIALDKLQERSSNNGMNVEMGPDIDEAHVLKLSKEKLSHKKRHLSLREHVLVVNLLINTNSLLAGTPTEVSSIKKSISRSFEKIERGKKRKPSLKRMNTRAFCSSNDSKKETQDEDKDDDLPIGELFKIT